jgi:hypothetical protein
MHYRFLIAIFFLVNCNFFVYAEQLSSIIVNRDKNIFIYKDTEKEFIPFGVNYDHDYDFKLIEDYWSDKHKISEDFAYIKKLGFNVVRIHLQQFVYLMDKTKMSNTALKNLDWILHEAEKNNLYLDITGLGRYKGIIPKWYRNLNDAGRIEADAFFWKIISERYKGRGVIFCFDLQNEPTINYDDKVGYVGPPFDDGYHYINRHFQDISKAWKSYLLKKYNTEGKFKESWLKEKFQTYEFFEKTKMKVPDIFSSKEQNSDFINFKDMLALKWLSKLSNVVKDTDSSRLVTLGLCGINLPYSKYYSSFSPESIKPYVDFICIHFVPNTITQEPYCDNAEEFIKQIKTAYVGKPLIVEEFFPLVPLDKLYSNFVKPVKQYVNGWISYYWGKPINELKKSDKISDQITADWLKYFSENKNKFEM